MAPTRRTRIGGTALVVPLLVLLGFPGPASAAEQVSPGTADGASVQKTGWWWRVNEAPADAAPVAPPKVSPPNVPAGSLPVSAVTGETEKVAALEFTLAATPGATVSSFVLSLREADDPGANAASDTAKVAACQVTEAFWTEGEAASWQARPDFDCAQGSAAGTRGADGVWTFDLTGMASQWLAADTTQAPSVVLVEQAEAQESFQVVYDGVAANGIGVRLAATPGPAPGSGDGAGDPGFTDGGSAVGDGGFGGSGSVPADGGAVPGMDEVPASAEPPDAAAEEPGEQSEVTPVAQPALFDNIPAAALWLIPVGLVAAYLLMLALGPNGEPVTATAGRGVSRALDLRRARRALGKGVR